MVVAHDVTLDQSTPWFASCSNTATITFIGTNTALQATTVCVNGTITHPRQSDVTGTPGVYADWTPDSRIWIVCSNLTVGAGKSIDAMGAGYKNAQVAYGSGMGPGGGVRNAGVAGGYGGGARPYGSATQPEDPGSGGGMTGHVPADTAGDGGGAVRIDATGAVTVNGTITANGRDTTLSSAYGGGSGGSVWIRCRTLEGSASGLISADGSPASASTASAAGGGGARIAIEFDTAAQSNVTSHPRITVSGGAHSTAPGAGGTLYVSHPMVLPVTLSGGAVLSWPAGINWTANSLVFSNGAFTVDMTNVAVLVTGRVDLIAASLKLKDSATLQCARADLYAAGLELMKYSTLQCAGLTLTNTSYLTVYAGVTNGNWPEYGALVSVTGDMDVHSNCVVYPYAGTSTNAPWVSGSPRFDVENLTIHAGGSFNGNLLGYAGGPAGGTRGYGPGGGGRAYDGAGGGYGGVGGVDSGGGNAGPTYGSATNPVAPGSGGGGGQNDGPGGAGGGSVWIRASGAVTINGPISANGGTGAAATTFTGGGSGGGVLIVCRKIQGTANISANGGNSQNATRGGCGGGGRIAVWYNTTPAQFDAFLATGDGAHRLTTNAPAGYGLEKLSAAAGTTGTAASDGTKFFYSIPPPFGTVLIVQ